MGKWITLLLHHGLRQDLEMVDPCPSITAGRLLDLHDLYLIVRGLAHEVKTQGRNTIDKSGGKGDWKRRTRLP